MVIWAIMPVKRLAVSKQRLAPILSAGQRAALMRALLTDHLRLLAHIPALAGTLVVSGDAAVQQLARDGGAHVLAEHPNGGLNRALRDAAAHLRGQADLLLILPADLPLLARADIDAMLAHAPEAALCSDRHGTGTNGLLVSAEPPFHFQFGPRSFDHHVRALQALGAPFHIVATPGIQFDLDTPEDWYACAQLSARAPFGATLD